MAEMSSRERVLKAFNHEEPDRVPVSSTVLLINPKIFIEHVFPWLMAYCDEAHRLGMKVLKHCCGRTWEIFDYFIKAGKIKR